jgi:hypothetical protein
MHGRKAQPRLQGKPLEREPGDLGRRQPRRLEDRRMLRCRRGQGGARDSPIEAIAGNGCRIIVDLANRFARDLIVQKTGYPRL